jgi:hypothetical protein
MLEEMGSQNLKDGKGVTGFEVVEVLGYGEGSGKGRVAFFISSIFLEGFGSFYAPATPCPPLPPKPTSPDVCTGQTADNWIHEPLKTAFAYVSQFCHPYGKVVGNLCGIFPWTES